ncbi:MAG: hypothetical protein ACR2QH_10665 [Geminicoccaceae bacterium]
MSLTGKAGFLFAASALAVSVVLNGAASATDSDEFCLTLLHTNDGESQLLNAGSGVEDFSGADRFAAVVNQQRKDAKANDCSNLTDSEQVKRSVLLPSSGDKFLAGPEFTASLENGVPFFDSVLIDLLRRQRL